MENFEFNKNTICKYTEKELREASLLIAKELEERTYKKKEKLTDAFKRAWDDLEKEGIEIWFSGNEYTAEEDFRLKLDEVYFD